MDTLGRKTIKGLFWVSSAKVVEQLISWVLIILLARLLVPADFGLVATATIFIQFLNYFTELSLGAALVQKQAVDETDLSTCFSLKCLGGVLTFAVMYLFSNVVGNFLGQEGLPAVLTTLSLSVVISAPGSLPYDLIVRQLQFHKQAAIDLLANLAMGFTSVGLALLGFGVWSLVYGAIAKQVLFSVLCFSFRPWWPRAAVSFARMSQFLKFGVPFTAYKFCSAFYYNVDTLIVGKFLGATVLGHYHMAFNLSTKPVEKLAAIIGQVYFPVFSRLQKRRDELETHFLKTSQYITFLIFPAIGGLYLTADSLIPLLLGPRWAPAVVPLKVLCIVGLVRSMDVAIPPLLMGLGKADRIFRYSLARAILLPAGFLVGVQFGLGGVLAAWAILYPCLFLYLLRLALRELNLPASRYVRHLLPSLTGTFLMGLAILLLRSIAPQEPHWRLIAIIVTGCATYVGYMFFLQPALIREITTTIHSFRVSRAQARSS